MDPIVRYPLSPMQQGLLFHSLSAPSSGVYVAQVTCRLAPDADLTAFERAWESMLRRHAILRTSFAWDGVEPLQRVHEDVQCPVTRHDCRTADAAAMDAFLAADRARGFDLARAPLMRMAVCDLAGGDRLFVWTHHHILLDGRARVRLLEEVALVYGAYAAGRELELPLAPEFRNYIEWLRHEDTSGAEEFWRRLLGPSYFPVRLTIAPGADADVTAGEYSTQAVSVTPTLEQALRRVARENDVTVNILLQAAWAVLLARHTGESSVVFGATRSCRRAGFKGIANLVGVVMNTLPHRLQVDVRRPFADVLADLRAQHVAMRRYQHTPLIRIREWSGVDASVPLFDSVVVFEEHDLTHALDGERFALWRGGLRRAVHTHYGVTLAGYARPTLRLDLCCHRDVCSPAGARRLGDVLGNLLEGIAASGRVATGDLPILSPIERLRILEHWNDTQRPVRDVTLPALFEDQVRRTPSDPAVVYDDRELCYSELNDRANRLAHLLVELGIGPEMTVAVAMRRSEDLVIALLATLKAGGVYLPVNLEDPPHRLAAILDDARPACILSADEGPLPWRGTIPALALGSPATAERLSRCSSTNPRRAVLEPDNLAYIVFTSGSTGRPKGVGVTHRAIVNKISTIIGFLGITGATRFAATSAVTFDPIFDQILCPLCAGGISVVMPDAIRDDARLFSRYASLHGVTIVNATPGLVEHWLSAGELRVDTLMIGGDVLPARLASRLREMGAARRILNMYGPTETCINAAAFEVPRSDAAAVPIGSALPNYRLYVLDSRLSPVPVGIAGELWIAGAGVARGYVNRPGMTAERFFPDPYGAAHTRMYRTGDRVRWRGDGNLEFLGRLDRQVKIRGARIEPAEIERVLEEHPAVERAVIGTNASSDEARLTACVVAAKGASTSEDELRAFLTRRLPTYMIPESVLFLDALPLTAQAKIDVAAVLQDRSHQAVPVRTTRTPEEDVLCELFAEVLGRQGVEVDGNFFALGGHSLHATRLASRIRAVLGAEVAISTLFEAPTPERLAARLRSAERVRPPLTPQPRPDPMPLSYAQHRLWFLDRLGSATPEYNVTVALRLRGPLDRRALTHAIQTIVARHESLRTHIAMADGQPVQAIAPARDIPCPLHDLRSLDAGAREACIRAALRRELDEPFDLERGPLVRVRILQCGDEDHLLVRTVHHIVSDGWSQGVFNRELSVLYDAFRDGRNDPLAPLQVQYADWALWQRAWLHSGALDEGLEYWATQLAGIPEEVALPSDRPRQARRSPAAEQHDAVVSRERAGELKRIAYERNATLFMTLLAALGGLLARYSGDEEVVVGSPIANRQDARVEGLIGCFVNALPLRVRVPAGITFGELLGDVRRTTLEAYRHQDVPFERIVERLMPRRSLSTTPIFQVMLLLQNAPAHSAQLAGLAVQPVAGGVRAHHDIELYVRERDGCLDLSWVYNADRFERETIEKLASEYDRLLRAIVERPGETLSTLTRPSHEEWRQVTDGGSRRPELPLACVHEAVEAWAQRTPHAIAVLGPHERVTYGELNERAARLAHALAARPGSVVGVAMARSSWMVASMLAVMRTGAAYLPLDPSLPKARLRFFVEDAGVSQVLTDHCTRGAVAGCGARLIDVETLASGRVPRASVPRVPGGTLDHVVYVIYTSGSTGKPKGVAVSHRALASTLADLRVRLDVTTASRTFALSNVAFDITAVDFFLPLVAGGSCWLASSPLAAGAPIVREIAVSGCSILQVTPSGWRALVDQGWQGDGRVVALSGAEPLPVPLARELLRTCGSVWNLYGPTETAIYATGYRVVGDERTLPMGRPLAGVRAYVLDPQMEPLPIGAVGELFIGGDGVAVGYVKRPDLTAAAFVPDACSGTPGARLYKTGDLVRYRSNGVLEFLGRRDHQVKVRGFRVELGEIEAALAAQPGVSRVVVVARMDRPDDVRLVAYVVPEGDLPEAPAARSDQLRRAIRERLPEYMVPSAVVWLAALPLTPTGKIDRGRLPAPDLEPAAPVAPPQTTAERKMATIWREVLGCAEVGRRDDFFALGGHSLAAMQVASRVLRDLGVDLPLHVIFERPVLADVAAHLESCAAAPALEPAASFRGADVTI